MVVAAALSETMAAAVTKGAAMDLLCFNTCSSGDQSAAAANADTAF